ncbi:MAG: FHA domain-containing protein [Nostocales cyanobacterium]|nr:MAG: FHA domain-containing protein [Nostocales cyanobacterium]TAF14185.1 MAG: FHA domain-containing protein [Nostocales cyanobacterium]
MTQLTLVLTEGNTETEISVKQDVFIIGRLPDCDLFLPFGGISRRHARIVKSSRGIWTIEDMGSKNGTQLNYNSVTTPQELHDGDVILLGNVTLTVDFTTDVETPYSQYLKNPETNSQAVTILRDVQELQQQWIEASGIHGKNNKEKAIARLKDLVEIAKNLCAAASIEEIFSQVQQVVFRYIDGIERLALLIDVDNSGTLQLINSAIKNNSEQIELPSDGSWISRSICQKVFTEKVAIQSADTRSDERFSCEQSILVKGIMSAMAVPLWDEDKVVGVLYGDANLYSSHWENNGEEELSFFSTLANLVASSVQRWLLAERLKNQEVIRQRLERYHSPAVVQQLIIAKSFTDIRLPPIEREISILFADLVGFTEISERKQPTEIAELLNKLFEEMLKEVFANGGTLDKYIGDCIMAFFGAPEPQIDHADQAVSTAKAMLSRLQVLNASNFWDEPLQLRIAINSGKAIVGDVGSSQRLDYTALGPTINLAARMEQICPIGECVISEATYHILTEQSDFQLMGDHRFKGIGRVIKVYQTNMSLK